MTINNIVPLFKIKQSLSEIADKDIEKGIKKLDKIINQYLIPLDGINHLVSYAELSMKFIYLASKLKDKKLATEALQMFNEMVTNLFLTNEK